jgi:hypothetical protein
VSEIKNVKFKKQNYNLKFKIEFANRAIPSVSDLIEIVFGFCFEVFLFAF